MINTQYFNEIKKIVSIIDLKQKRSLIRKKPPKTANHLLNFSSSFAFFVCLSNKNGAWLTLALF